MIRTLTAALAVLTAGIVAAQPQVPTPPVPPKPPEPIASPAPVEARPPGQLPAEMPPIVPPSPVPDIIPPTEGPCKCPPKGVQVTIFADADFGLLIPHVNNGLWSPVIVQPFGVGDIVTLPAVEQDAAVSFNVTLGYRLNDDLGTILLTYRNLASEGTSFFRNFDFVGDGIVKSRLDINSVGLAYGTREQPLGALWSTRWEIGAKWSSIYFDSQGQGAAIGQHASNYFTGVGPAVALDLARELPPTGLAFFSRAEFTDLIGSVTQRFSETVGDPNRPIGFGYAEEHGSQGVPVLGIQAGLSWLSRPDGHYRLTVGYSYEHWWAVGKVGHSTGDVMAQGIFMRSEFMY